MAEISACSHPTSWSVKMAQYIPPPPAPPPEAFAFLQPFFRKRRSSNLRGTWLSSKSMATVTVSAATCNGLGPSIALILRGRVHEEHFLSTVALTWPKYRGDNTETSTFGRTILASYKITSSNENRKFAMQFETVLQAEWFLETLKQLIAFDNGAAGGIENAHTQNVTTRLLSDSSESCLLGAEGTINGSVSSAITSRETLRSRRSDSCNEELSIFDPPENTGSPFATNDSPIVLPPRFPSLYLQQHQIQLKLAGCEQQEGVKANSVTEGSQSEESLKEKLKACLLDPEFQDFVSQVERIWQSMEEELLTELSI